MLSYFPLDEAHKTPIGGVKVNAPLRISVTLTGSQSVTGVSLVLLQEQTKHLFKMNKVRGKNFTLMLQIPSSGVYGYFFRTDKGQEYYADEDLRANVSGRPWQLTVYERIYALPEWFTHGIVYQIMPDRFYVGGQRLKTKESMNYRDDWGGTPTFEPNGLAYPNNDMFGGNIYGIIEKIPYLKSLNVKTVYLTPIFESPSSHKYDTGDYFTVDGDFGGNDALIALIKALKENDMRLILDGVFSHTGADSLYFNKFGNYNSVGAYQSKDSPYFAWYTFFEYPDRYDCWWGVDILPNVNENDPAYDSFINGTNGVIRTYFNLGVDGWRLDVADELPVEFLSRLCKTAKSQKSDALVLGEVWEDASCKYSYGTYRPYLLGRQIDSVTNYPFRSAIIDFVLSGDAAAFRRSVNLIADHYPPENLQLLMNMLSTHDVQRILTMLSGDPMPQTKTERAEKTPTDIEKAESAVRLAAILQYALPGVPMLYYGDEVGMAGYEDPFNRRCYPWGKENTALLSFFKRLGRLRADKTFVVSPLEFDYSYPRDILVFTRGKYTIVINRSNSTFSLGCKMREFVLGELISEVEPFCGGVFY